MKRFRLHFEDRSGPETRQNDRLLIAQAPPRRAKISTPIGCRSQGGYKRTLPVPELTACARPSDVINAYVITQRPGGTETAEVDRFRE